MYFVSHDSDGVSLFVCFLFIHFCLIVVCFCCCVNGVVFPFFDEDAARCVINKYENN